METETQLSADLSRGLWNVYAGEMEDHAAAKFETKFGYPPEYIVEYNGQLWLGPVKDRGQDGQET